jgi:integrase
LANCRQLNTSVISATSGSSDSTFSIVMLVRLASQPFYEPDENRHRLCRCVRTSKIAASIPFGDMPMNRKVMVTALRGTKHKGKVKTPGICAPLGLQPFTPHDLRRTAATLAGDFGFDDTWIAKCLDHAASKKQEQIVPSVTGKVYNQSG